MYEPRRQRIPPAAMPRLVRTVVPNAVNTLVLPISNQRFGFWLGSHIGGNVLYTWGLDGTLINSVIAKAAYNIPEQLYLFCDYGKLIWRDLFASHIIGVDQTIDVIEWTLPHDAWQTIFAESITDMRPPAKYP